MNRVGRAQMAGSGGTLLLGLFQALVQCLTRNSEAQSRNGLIALGSFQGLFD